MNQMIRTNDVDFSRWGVSCKRHYKGLASVTGELFNIVKG